MIKLYGFEPPLLANASIAASATAESRSVVDAIERFALNNGYLALDDGLNSLRKALGLEVVTEGLDAFIDTFGSGYVDLARLGRLLALGSRTGQLGGLDAPTDRSTAPRAMSACRCAAVMPVTPVMSMRS